MPPTARSHRDETHPHPRPASAADSWSKPSPCDADRRRRRLAGHGACPASSTARERRHARRRRGAAGNRPAASPAAWPWRATHGVRISFSGGAAAAATSCTPAPPATAAAAPTAGRLQRPAPRRCAACTSAPSARCACSANSRSMLFDPIKGTVTPTATVARHRPQRRRHAPGGQHHGPRARLLARAGDAGLQAPADARPAQGRRDERSRRRRAALGRPASDADASIIPRQ